MAWRLELVNVEKCAVNHRIHVCAIEEIDAPENVDGVGLSLKQTQQILGAV